MNRTYRYQKGVTAYQLLISLCAIGFLILAFFIRFQLGVLSQWQDAIFRVIILTYFIFVGIKIVPSMAIWSNNQDFMRQAFAKDGKSKSMIAETVLLLACITLSGLMIYSILSGTIPKMERHGNSNIEYNSIHQIGEFWSNAIFGYVLTLIASTGYWQMRIERLGKK